MALEVNLRHLETKSVSLQGELSAEELDLAAIDELITLARPAIYSLEVQKMESALLVQGDVRVVLRCHCVRCLKPFDMPIDLSGWVSHIPLTGEDQAVVANDLVDLTPYLREDILLAFPQHPLCKNDCGGLGSAAKEEKKTGEGSSTWAELNKLKFK